MEVNLQPERHPPFPVAGVLIEGSSAAQWAAELQRLGLAESVVYALPGVTAASIWGCLAVCDVPPRPDRLNRAVYARLAGGLLFLPDYTTLQPALQLEELRPLLKGERYLLHPEVGLFHLSEPLDWSSLLEVPGEAPCTFTRPAAGVFIPQAIRSFQIQPAEPEDVLQALEETAFPKPEPLDDRPLNPLEQLRRHAYRLLFKKTEERSGSEKTGLARWLERVLMPLEKAGAQPPVDRMQEDNEALQERSKAALDRLLDLLRNDPQEALKYAVPLDPDRTSRGSSDSSGGFQLRKLWNDLSLFGAQGSTGRGSAVFEPDAFAQLQAQYRATAEALEKSGAYEKAAFVHLKLLKNPLFAAQVLEAGGRYAEAASLYLKHLGNKDKAAECYEKGNVTQRALELYEELGQYEKVGDLYQRLGQDAAAMRNYEKVVEHYVLAGQYRKAAALKREKMIDYRGADGLLLEGWRTGREAVLCLKEYFSSIGDEDLRAVAVRAVYDRDTTVQNRERFLTVLKASAGSGGTLGATVRELAYEIVAEQAPGNPAIVSELKAFNASDAALARDVMRYQTGLKRGVKRAG